MRADGSEPGPVHLGFGSSAASIVETREWWAYGELAEAIDRLHVQLADQAPVAALRAVGALERVPRGVAREAAYPVQDEEPEWEAIGVVLGLDAERARRLDPALPAAVVRDGHLPGRGCVPVHQLPGASGSQLVQYSTTAEVNSSRERVPLPSRSRRAKASSLRARSRVGKWPCWKA